LGSLEANELVVPCEGRQQIHVIVVVGIWRGKREIGVEDLLIF
jgi:hypothetical protein